MNEVEIAGIDEDARTLAKDEHGVEPVDRIGQQRQAAPNGEIPERGRDHALPAAFRRDPLYEEARREQRLAEQADSEPDLVRRQSHDRAPAYPSVSIARRTS